MPKLAIVVPVYNQEKWISYTLESIHLNRPKSSSVFVHNDGSRDKSGIIAKKLCEKYRFNYSEDENKGIARTLNVILRKVEDHKFFFVIGCDDILAPGGLQSAINKHELMGNAGGVYGRVNLIDERGCVIKEMKMDGEEGMIYEKVLLSKISVPIQFVVWRISALKAVGGYDERFKIEDLPIFRKISKIYPIGFVDELVIGYRKIGQGLSASTLVMLDEARKINELLKGDPVYGKLQNIFSASAFLTLSKRHKLHALRFLPRALASGRFTNVLKGLCYFFFYHKRSSG
jgi:glycosyltransferase involved in cell wall biosynthesis